MGLLSKLFGDSKARNEAMDMLKEVANAAKNFGEELEKNARKVSESGAQSNVDPFDVDARKNSAQQTASKPDAVPVSPVKKSTGGEAPYGVSWGKHMPDEENQFSFGGSYTQYFEEIFREEFPMYQLEKESAAKGKAMIFTFMQGGRKALVVEILSENSGRKKVRSECAEQGVPYIRYYHDHEGWWNTRNYVVSRTRAALGC